MGVPCWKDGSKSHLRVSKIKALKCSLGLWAQGLMALLCSARMPFYGDQPHCLYHRLLVIASID